MRNNETQTSLLYGITRGVGIIFWPKKYKVLFMTEEYKTVSTAANIVQAIFQVLKGLNPENIEIPADEQEVVHEIEACIARCAGGK